MYRSALVPLDGTQFAEGEIDHAMNVVADHGTLYLVRIVTAPTLSAFPAEALTSAKIQESFTSELRSAERYLETTRARILQSRPSLKVEILARRGSVEMCLKSVVSEVRPEIVVMASEQKSALERLFTHSVSEALINDLSQPVLIVHGPAATKA